MKQFDEISQLVRHINQEMPLYSKDSAKIPHTYQQFPKNIGEYSTKVNDKFLNNNLDRIEELWFRNKNKTFSNWFIKYQTRYFREAISHDGFFKIITQKHRGAYAPQSMLTFSFASLNRKVFGATLETGGTTNHVTGQTGYIQTSSLPAGVVGEFYDEVAQNYFAVAGNYRQCVYNEESGTPGTLYSETGSIAVPAGYVFQSLTEFSLNQTANHVAMQVDSSSAEPYYNLTSGGNFRTWTFGAFENPHTGGTNQDARFNQKVAHT